MNRRLFLKALLGAAAASTTTYFLPPINGWTSDVIAHPPMAWEFLGGTITNGETLFFVPSGYSKFMRCSGNRQIIYGTKA